MTTNDSPLSQIKYPSKACPSTRNRVKNPGPADGVFAGDHDGAGVVGGCCSVCGNDPGVERYGGWREGADGAANGGLVSGSSGRSGGIGTKRSGASGRGDRNAIGICMATGVSLDSS